MLRGLSRRLASLALVLPAALMAGCQSETTTGPRIVGLAIVDGLGQTGVVGAELSTPLAVRVADQSNVAVAGALVTWSVVSGGGQVTPSQSVTDADGRASATFRLGATIGVQTVRAGLQGAQTVTFTATATAAPASQLAVAGGNNQSGTVAATLPQRLTVRAADTFNNPKAGVLVTFQVTSGGGSLSAATATTDAQGVAGVDWTLGTIAGAQTVSASTSGLPAVGFAATAVAAAASQVAILSGSGQSAAPGTTLSDSLVVQVRDAFGNPVKDATVTFTALGDAGAVSPGAALTNAAGRAAAAWTLGATGGPKEVRASVGGAPPVLFQAAGTIVFASVNAGARHSCGLDTGGVAYCWGFNGDGQLGMGQAAQGSGPVFAGPQPIAVTGALTFANVSSGGFHTCGWTLSANPYCWGKNVDGRVGNGGFEQVNAPAHVSGVHVFNRIGSGGTHTCALTLGGRLYCWGSNAEGQVGVVGAAVIPQDSLAFSTPLPVMPAATWSAVAGGGLHGCAILSGGAAWCWGNNAFGQLGDGTLVNANTPAAVTGALSFTAITAGANHTCGLTAAGAAQCWGDNQHGQLGDGTVVGSSAPVPVTGGLIFVALTAGDNHTCGLTAAGIAWCWGLNARGQLGTGGTANALAPAVVGGGHAFANLSAGAAQTCGVTTGQEAYCWGDNQYGQLGDGTQVQRTLPAKVAFQ